MAHTGVERRGCVEKTQSFTNVSGSKTTICVTTEVGAVIRRVVYCRDCSGGGTTSRRRRGSGGGYAVLYQSAQGGSSGAFMPRLMVSKTPTAMVAKLLSACYIY